MSALGWDKHDSDCAGDAAAYVLGALEDYEVTPFLRHLEACAICRDEVTSLQVVADMLPAAVTAVMPPRGLRRRVLATVYEEAEMFRAAGTASRDPVKKRIWRPIPRAFQALAAASLVAAGVGVGAVALGGPSSSANRVILASATGPTTAMLHISAGRTELAVADLPAAPAGRVYEVWLKRKGTLRPTDALFTPTSDGHATVAVPGDLHGVAAVMVTDEPSGGSSLPTRSPVITASLQ